MSNRENTQEYSKDMLRIQIVDSNGIAIINKSWSLLLALRIYYKMRMGKKC
ncbi:MULTISPECIES: hypothetical protein [Helicobacter]|uniref:Uncharacterized protein n=1 Tax=Helicobacter bilis ATCC 43879 TaxID=613026 RepID=T5LP86_9HELI|nr:MULTISPECIES: hypothetical protein [Helicobacter]EQM94769.1 hypothetical protein HRAG_02515 [Helicobacter bilis ATCC 43879]